ncbi:hypothetical protein [Ornithinibacillus scapharcae]|uniref:hypothetical protein n=1 Tax=Ornithinibacillus scapharcae TaxID=1147159 RepID=UPI0003162448|nr:hypothetical protein [Ornithinibacillus scapharcae]
MNNLNFFGTSDEEELPNFNKVEINTGKLLDNVNVIYSDHNLPMVMNKSFGLGEVTQFAFNISSETLTKWEDYDQFWSKLLQKTVDKDVNRAYMRDEIPYRLSNIVEIYPSSFIPVEVLVTLYIVYLVLLIPGLYFLLKKLDKREISWVIIPAVAIVSSIAIFVVGAKDRIGGSQINHISVLSIDEEGTANGYGAFSILSNNAGDYPVTINSRGFQPYPMQNYNYGPDEAEGNLAMIEIGRQQSKITFNGVEFWSIRSAMGNIHSLETGKLNSDLWIENNKLKGTVKSELAFDLTDAYLLSGSNSYPLGEIKAGETTEIELELDTKNIQNLIGAPRANIASKVIPGHTYSGGYSGYSEPQDKETIKEWKKYELLDSAMYFDVQPKNFNKPLIAGYVTEPIIELESDKKVKSVQSLSLITQMVDVEIRSLEAGEFKFSQNTIIPELSVDTANSSTGNIYHNGLLYGEGYVEVDQGNYLLTYQIPLQLNLDSIKVNKFRLSHPSSNEATFSIYNVKEGEYKALEGNQTTFEDNPGDFIADDGKIVVRFEKSGMNDPLVQIPTLNLEGEYNQ